MLILASSSPRRHELLLTAGIPHTVIPSHIPEERLPGEDPLAFVVRLAEEKARAVPRTAGGVVLGADTAVVVDGHILGKPADDADTRRMLRLLSGRKHHVLTGICLVTESACIRDASVTGVTFAELNEEEISGYTRSGESKDKAGGYAIQGLASKFVLSIEGCYSNVVGLPVSLVYRHLKSLCL